MTDCIMTFEFTNFVISRLFAQIREVEYASNSSPDVDSWGSLYFVGHSLGSHISAHAALLIKESQKKQENSWIVSRITGLDPAQPCFSTANLTLKLDKDDAPFVDVIHTNARNIYLLGLGLPDQLGRYSPGQCYKFLLIPLHVL